MRVAAVDCGTNSVRLLIADLSGETLSDVERRMEIVRLGQGVDRTGRLAPEALERTFAAMRGYRELIDRHGAVSTRVVATSATRDAANRDEFVAGVLEIFGVEPEVVSGAEEAQLSFTGATRSLTSEGDGKTSSAPGSLGSETGLASRKLGSGTGAGADSGAAGGGPEGPVLVVDIGGGSTEFVVGSGAAEAALSVDIGCVRLTERHFRDAGDPPAREAVEAVIADIEAALDRVADTVPVDGAQTLVGLAGSVTTVAGIALGLPAYDPERIHHSRIPSAQVHEVSKRLLEMTHEERAAIAVMHPGRVDVIAAGALILDRIVRRFGFSDVVVSEHDILDGIAWSQS